MDFYEIAREFIRLFPDIQPGLTLFLTLVNFIILLIIWKKVASRNGGAETVTAASLHREFQESRREAAEEGQRLRQELATAQKNSLESLIGMITELGKIQSGNLVAVERRIRLLAEANETHLKQLRDAIAAQLSEFRESNEQKLSEMRRTVDEKLQSTLEKRLGESFRLVSERLEAVQRGLGDMQSLASGVGDLKRMLTNVKTRGTWGEFQLGDLLEEILTPEQFSRNVETRPGSGAYVEYAVRLPGRGSDEPVWLPIDAKFPQEDYQRLLEAGETGDSEATARAAAALGRTVIKAAGEIAGKYLDPPRTTDFAIMFLPTEGLYSEILRQPGMVEKLQHEFRIVAAGPTTLAALLNSLRMGFRTLAIEKRSSEVWKVLAAVKTEFARFEVVLARVQKQLETAAGTIEKTGVRTRAMKRKLKDVEELPDEESVEELLEFEELHFAPENEPAHPDFNPGP